MRSPLSCGPTAPSHMQSTTTFRNAYYIKLGRGGCWETDSLARSLLRLGWQHQTIDDINTGRWDTIERQLREECAGKPQVATTDLNRLRDIAESTSEDIWITFHGAKLWWARLADGEVLQDEISKYRKVQGAWSDRSGTGRLLVASELPGKLAQLQGFRGTVCRVQEAELLRRVLSGTRSDLAAQLASRRAQLADSVRIAIEQLHWKDYETLVDLVFRSAGWIRISILGQQVKGFDLELREPITQDKYVVQVKSQASLRDLEDTVAQFSPDDYRRVFFVVHSPSKDLAAFTGTPDHVELVAPQRLAELAIDAGLSRWIEEKVA